MPNTDSPKKIPLDEEYIPEIPEKKPVAAPAAPKITTARKARPLVEGINTPKNGGDVIFVKPTLTPEEKTLISETGEVKKEPVTASTITEQEPRLLSVGAAKRANRKNRYLGKILTIGIILLLLAFGGYKGYLWYLNRPSGVTPGSAFNYSQSQNSSSSLISDFASGTPSSLPTATSTASSTDMTASSTFPLAGGTVPVVTPTPAAASTPAGPQLKINSTPTGYLNVRSGPSTANPVVAQVHPGETYAYTSTQNGWYQITLTNGQSGWVSGQYVTAQ